MKETKIYNLKNEYNWRGRVAELLTKYKLNTFLTKGSVYLHPLGLKKKQSDFLRKYWDTIDLYKFDLLGNLEIFEVKAKSEGVKRRPDITSQSLECYEEAKKLGISISLVYVYFLNDWHFSFGIISYKKSLFRENNGGWYRKKL